MAGVRESVEGLRAEFRTLAGIGRTFVKILRNVDHNVGFVADQMDDAEDGVAGTENGAGEPSTVGDGKAGNNGDGGVEGGVDGEKTVGVEGTENVMEETLQ